MENQMLRVEGMSCNHCVHAVVSALSALPAVVDIKVDLDSGTVRFRHDPKQADLLKIKQTINDQGYEVVE